MIESIRIRLAAGVGIVVLAAGAAAFNAAKTADRIRDEAAAGARHASSTLADRLSADMAESMRQLQALARLDSVRNGASDPAALCAVLAARIDGASSIALADAEGRVVASHPATFEGRSIADRAAFRQGRTAAWAGEAGARGPMSAHDDRTAVDIAVPVTGADGRLRGVLAQHRDGRWTATLRDEVLRAEAVPAGLALAVVGADAQARLGRAPAAALLPNAITTSATSRPLGDFKGFGWRVVADVDSAVVDARIGAARQRIWCWSLGLGTLLALGVAGVFGGKRKTDGLSTPTPSTRTDRRRPPVGDVAGALARLRSSLVAWGGWDRRAADPLTGLPNRTALTRLARELAEDGALGAHEFSVVCLDLDDFRIVNERHGRDVGDRALREVAGRIRRTARADDIVLRLGGDEFVVIAPSSVDALDSSASRIADRLLAALRQPFEGLAPSAVSVGACVGTAQWRPGGPLLVEAIAQAGEALMAAKRAGRNQVRHYASRRGRRNAAAETASPMS